MTKRISPYVRLQKIGIRYLNEIEFAKKTNMFHVPKDRMNNEYSFHEIYQRTIAAQQLGYEVILEANDTGLSIKYRERPKSRPWEFRN